MALSPFFPAPAFWLAGFMALASFTSASAQEAGHGVKILLEAGDDFPFQRDGGGTSFDADVGIGYRNFQLSGTYRLSTPDLREPDDVRASDHLAFSSQILVHSTWQGAAARGLAFGGGVYLGGIGNFDGQAMQCWYHSLIGRHCPNWAANPHPSQFLAGVEAWGRAPLGLAGPLQIEATLQGAGGNLTALARAGLLFSWNSSPQGRLPLPSLREFTAPDLSSGAGIGLLAFVEGGLDPAIEVSGLPIVPKRAIVGGALIGQMKLGPFLARATAQLSQPYYQRPGKPEGDARLGLSLQF